MGAISHRKKCPECEFQTSLNGHSTKCSRRNGVELPRPAKGAKLVIVAIPVSADEAKAVERHLWPDAVLSRLTDREKTRITVTPADAHRESVKDAACPRCGDEHLCWNTNVWCACGEAVVDETLFGGCMNPITGWFHTRTKCTPPPDPNRRCQCGFAILRNDAEVKKTVYKDHWSSVSYSSDDPKGWEREHYLAKPKGPGCMDHVDF